MSFHWQRFAGGVFGLYFWAQCSQDSLTALQGGGRKWKFGAFGEPVLLFITVLFISLTNKKITIRIFNLRSWGQDVVFFFFFKCYSQKSWKFLLLFRDKFCFVFLQYNDSDVVQFTYIVLTLPDGLFPLFLTTWEAFSFITASFWATSHPLPRSVVTLFSFMQISSVCNLSLMWRHI